MSWTQGSSTCNATYAGGASGTTSLLSDTVAPTTGTATAACTNGVVILTAPTCVTAAPPPPPPPPPPTGTYDAGLTKYMASCSGCHSAGTVDSGGSNLAGKGSKLVSNLGTLSGAMSGITLTAQEILDLQVFLSTVK